ncbi:PREDICTED: DALR anticodon-binding domain-containing protein 3 isoform X2 [Nicrophorus vespilloides]|uniref:DALR anticodon-binding domain-containing protein 3 isoform X2 n=1 Tax=Nicrophorus vespilloides TaxID=110193 RepID=A0ABM1NCI6_NICVS|nr:PREDICTED: DALR anticodon-binding domain-containing protein 3 isoform X2 [Nicrophorus vespilloides]
MEASKYGSYNMNKSLTLTTDVVNDDNLLLTELRVLLLMKVANNFLIFNNCSKTNGEIIKLCSKSLVNDDVIVCGPILNSKGSKDTETTSKVYYDQRTLDMRLMAEHKYGLRITSKPGWEEFFAKLGSAAVIIEMLQNRPNNCTTIDINNHYIKNASFILYNCARLSTLLKEFEKRVSENVYPPLIDIDEINFSLLEQPEEWELLYVYILQFPVLLKNCIKDIDTCKINVHYLVAHLGSMTSVFSGYYRRIKILIEPRDYLFNVLHARIYLLKALEQVFHNGLKLLDIEPVKQM